MTENARSGYFTCGVSADCYKLPHPKLGLPVILLIRRVLRRAFQILREQGFRFSEAKEDDVTAGLKSVIENHLLNSGEVRGFNRRFYESVVRQGQVETFDGTSLTTAPDLTFKLRHDDESRPVISECDGLFIECKPVDAKHAAGGRYCDDGLIKFVDGRYAWAMQEAMMLAYARNGRTIAGHLIPAMMETTRREALATVQIPEACPDRGAAASLDAEAVHISRHRRGFPWRDNKGPATDITIYHLWHDCC